MAIISLVEHSNSTVHTGNVYKVHCLTHTHTIHKKLEQKKNPWIKANQAPLLIT